MVVVAMEVLLVGMAVLFVMVVHLLVLVAAGLFQGCYILALYFFTA